jgi:hypothetical protein
LIKRNAIFFIGGPLFFFYKRQSEAIHYYESFLAVSGGPGYEMSRRVGELPRSGFVHIENKCNSEWQPVIPLDFRHTTKYRSNLFKP